MKRFPVVITAYLVSWSLEIVYAEIAVVPDGAQEGNCERYGFSTTSNTMACSGAWHDTNGCSCLSLWCAGRNPS